MTTECVEDKSTCTYTTSTYMLSGGQTASTKVCVRCGRVPSKSTACHHDNHSACAFVMGRAGLSTNDCGCYCHTVHVLHTSVLVDADTASSEELEAAGDILDRLTN